MGSGGKVLISVRGRLFPRSPVFLIEANCSPLSDPNRKFAPDLSSASAVLRLRWRRYFSLRLTCWPRRRFRVMLAIFGAFGVVSPKFQKLGNLSEKKRKKTQKFSPGDELVPKIKK